MSEEEQVDPLELAARRFDVCASRMLAWRNWDQATAERFALSCQQFAIDCRAAALSLQDHGSSNGLINDIIRDVAELPDRTSPADQPDMMLVSADELRSLLMFHLSENVPRGDWVDAPRAMVAEEETK